MGNLNPWLVIAAIAVWLIVALQHTTGFLMPAPRDRHPYPHFRDGSVVQPPPNSGWRWNCWGTERQPVCETEDDEPPSNQRGRQW